MISLQAVCGPGSYTKVRAGATKVCLVIVLRGCIELGSPDASVGTTCLQLRENLTGLWIDLSAQPRPLAYFCNGPRVVVWQASYRVAKRKSDVGLWRTRIPSWMLRNEAASNWPRCGS